MFLAGYFGFQQFHYLKIKKKAISFQMVVCKPYGLGRDDSPQKKI
jgi:hypothetical protein